MKNPKKEKFEDMLGRFETILERRHTEMVDAIIKDYESREGATMIFAERLKEARASAGMTQQAMADRTLIPKRTIEDWESGRRTPPPYVQRFVLNELESLKNEGATE